MTGLTRKDLAALFESLERIYAATDLDALATETLSTVSQLVAVDAVACNEYRVDDGGCRYVVAPAGADPPGGEALFSQLFHEHPLVAYYQRTGDGRARTNFRLPDPTPVPTG